MKLGDHVLYQMNNGTKRLAVVTTEFAPYPCLAVFLIPGEDFLVYQPDAKNFATAKWDSVLMEKFPPNLILGQTQAVASVQDAQQGYSPGQWHEVFQVGG